jgi:hypothetical protein
LTKTIFVEFKRFRPEIWNEEVSRLTKPTQYERVTEGSMSKRLAASDAVMLVATVVFVSAATYVVWPSVVRGSDGNSAASEEGRRDRSGGRVGAQIYAGGAVGGPGYIIGFTLPGYDENCDPSELDGFLRGYAGHRMYSPPGQVGAPMLAAWFDDVTDKRSAQMKIEEIVPALERLAVRLGDCT